MENQDIYEDDEEISLSALLITIARSWRCILAAALIGAVLVGGLFAFKDSKSGAKADEAGAAVTEAELSSTEAEYKRELKTAETDLENAIEYSENSLLMNLNPYEVYAARAVLYVDNNYKILPDSNYQNPDTMVALLNAYGTALVNRATLSEIARQQDLEERYLEELITVTPDSGARSLTVQVISDGEERSQAILDGLLDALEGVQTSIQRNIGTHEIRVISNTSSVVALRDLADFQKENRENIALLKQSKTDLQEEYDLAAQSVKNAESSQESAGIGKTVKYAVIGGVVCAFLVCVVAAVKFFASQKVYSGAELHDKTGLSVLGCLAGEKTKKEKGFDAWLSSLERRANGSGDRETLQLIAATVCRLAPDAENILVTGDLTEAQLASLRDGLQATQAMSGKKITAADSVLRAAQSVERVAAADEILLAVECGKTYNDDVRAQNEKIRELGKRILGCVVYE